MSICLCSSYGRPNERKGRINNLDSGLWFTAPFHDLHARRRRHHSIHLPSCLELDRFARRPHHSASYQRRVNSPPYFNFLLCCRPSGRSFFFSVSHVRRTITDHMSAECVGPRVRNDAQTKNLASWLERPDWRGGQLSFPVKRVQFTSHILRESLCDLMWAMFHLVKVTGKIKAGQIVQCRFPVYL